MDRVWAETPTLPGHHQPVEAIDSPGEKLLKHECSSPSPEAASVQHHDNSPSGPSGPEAVRTYTEIDHQEGMTVIRSLNPEEDHHQHTSVTVDDKDLVYQNLGELQTTMASFHYAYPQMPSYATTSCNVLTMPYPTAKLNHYDPLGNGQNTVIVPEYESPSPHQGLVSPSPNNMPYGSPGQLGPSAYSIGPSHSPLQNPAPMWNALSNTGASYNLDFATSNAVVDNQDIARSNYVYGNATYISQAPGDTVWPAYPEKPQTLPHMSSVYLQDNRRPYDCPEYPRFVEPLTQCAMCGTTENNSWRKDATGQFVCSNCGIYKNGRSSSSLRPQKRLSTTRRIGMTCSNCRTNDTTLWRRNGQGEPVCNACGLYYKLHQVNRPISMRKDSIQTRKRKPKTNGVSSRSRSSSSNSSRNKTPSTQATVSGDVSVYLPQGGSGETAVGCLTPTSSSHRTATSPILPSSATLSQQMQHLPPLDPQHGDPATDGPYLLNPNSVISIGPKLTPIGM